jgi:hypothetical protein
MTIEEKDIRSGIIIGVFVTLWELVEHYPQLIGSAQEFASTVAIHLVDLQCENSKNKPH